MDKGWEHWDNGDIPEAHATALKLVENSPEYSEALHLLCLTEFVQGHYSKSISAFSKISPEYSRYNSMGAVMVEAYFHLNKPDEALHLAKKLHMKSLDYLRLLADKPFKCDTNKTVTVPFSVDEQLPSTYWPGITGKINGKEVNIRFDTGADFLVIGGEIAAELGIKPYFTDSGTHDVSPDDMNKNIVDELVFGKDLKFRNVPVLITASLGKYVVFGTSILEQFLVTVDYPASKFVFTPRTSEKLISKHRKQLPGNSVTVPFYLWGDHYMFLKGSVHKYDNLNFFLNSGMVALTTINDKLEQASLSVSKQKLVSWGIEESKLDQTTFFPTKYTLKIDKLVQNNVLIWYNANHAEDIYFRGIRIDGVVSHAFLSRYSWTLDFDKFEYIFGLPD